MGSAPSFFIIAEEVFSRGLLALYAAGAVKLHVPRGSPATSSHILFADDTIIFRNGSKRSLERLMESTSGQLINKALAAVLYWMMSYVTEEDLLVYIHTAAVQSCTCCLRKDGTQHLHLQENRVGQR
jgi:hypothetical protein